MNGLTMGSLFDGIGGFPLAAIRHGITPLWASEIVAVGTWKFGGHPLRGVHYGWSRYSGNCVSGLVTCASVLKIFFVVFAE